MVDRAPAGGTGPAAAAADQPNPLAALLNHTPAAQIPVARRDLAAYDAAAHTGEQPEVDR